MKKQSILSVLAISCAAMSVPAADWPQFRGPNGLGIADGSRPPVHFSAASNLLWKVEVPPGHSSPIVLGNRLFFNACETNALLTCAVDRRTGRLLWRRAIAVEKLEPTHAINNPAPCTPASDGRWVFSYLPSFGLVAYDLNGREQWRKKLPLPQTFRDQGSGSSPLLAGGLIVIEMQLGKDSHLLAVSARDGSEVWKAPKPLQNVGWATPIFWKDKTGDYVGSTCQGRFTAYRLKNSQEIWWTTGLGMQACATPVVTGDSVLISTAGVLGGPSNIQIPPPFEEAARQWDTNGDGLISLSEIPENSLMTDRKASGGQGNMTLRQIIGWSDREQAQRGYDQANWEKLRQKLLEFRDGELNRTVLMSVRLGGTGDVTKTHVIWQESRGVPEVPSPLVYRDHIYLVRNGGLLGCREAATGKMIYDERLGAEGGYYASPLGADGKVYLASDRGTISVVAAGDQFSVLARNDLGEAVFASPAVVKDILYVRSTHHLWAFGR